VHIIEKGPGRIWWCY